jgi:hypothetical protein
LLKSEAIIKSMRPLLRKILLYSDQLVILNFEPLRDRLNDFFFGDRIRIYKQFYTIISIPAY